MVAKKWPQGLGGSWGSCIVLAAARLQAACLLPVWHTLEGVRTCGYQLQVPYELRMLCQCSSRKRIVLRGTHPTLKKPWTSVAESYPRGFCCVVAGSLCSDIGWCRKLNVAGCSKTCSLREGEAKNPGPRRFREPRNLSLEHMPQQLAASVALGDRCWNSFHNWAAESLHAHDLLQLFLEVPLFSAHAIRRYGDLQFSSGGALLYYLYRHLVLAAQRRVPNLRQFAHVWWELAGRWELAEPVKHRIAPYPCAAAHSARDGVSCGHVRLEKLGRC